jgi:hypothetical protein
MVGDVQLYRLEYKKSILFLQTRMDFLQGRTQHKTASGKKNSAIAEQKI